MTFRFREPTPDDAQMILDWRTRPEIARNMASDVEYDVEKQKSWLAACVERPDYLHFIASLESDGRPVGLMSYSRIDWVERSCDPGFYLVLEPQERHLGFHLRHFSSDYCFHALGMRKICFGILSNNPRVLAGQRRWGLREIRVEPGAIERDGQLLDRHWFEQSYAEYTALPRHYPLERILSAFPPLPAKYRPPEEEESLL